MTEPDGTTVDEAAEAVVASRRALDRRHASRAWLPDRARGPPDSPL